MKIVGNLVPNAYLAYKSLLPQADNQISSCVSLQNQVWCHITIKIPSNECVCIENCIVSLSVLKDLINKRVFNT